MNNISSLGSLIQQGKLEEAKAVLASVVNAPLSDADRGQALVTLAMVYMEAKNKINQEFLDEIKKTIQEIKSLNKVESGINDQVDLAKVRANLQ